MSRARGGWFTAVLAKPDAPELIARQRRHRDRHSHDARVVVVPILWVGHEACAVPVGVLAAHLGIASPTRNSELLHPSQKQHLIHAPLLGVALILNLCSDAFGPLVHLPAQ